MKFFKGFVGFFYILTSIGCGPIETTNQRSEVMSMIKPNDINEKTVINNEAIPKYFRPESKSPLEDNKKKVPEKLEPVLIGIFKYSLLENAEKESLNWVTKQVMLPKDKATEV